MPRRFLTVEDLEALEGGEVVVDTNTIVTPQALDVARAAGITIRTTGGENYAEPTPERGPDAERLPSARRFPEPPEEGDAARGMVVTVVGRNRPGVLAEVAGSLANLDANIHDISQKMVEGYFHMVLTVEVPVQTTFGAIKSELECLGGAEDYVVRVMHERVFRFMHRI